MRDESAVVTGGVRLHLRRWDGEDRPFLLVHGLASNARLWDGVAAALAAAGHPVVAVDQRGHGRSAKPDSGYDLPTCAADLVAGDRPPRLGSSPVVAGQSWGGNVVLAVGARPARPDVRRCARRRWLDPPPRHVPELGGLSPRAAPAPTSPARRSHAWPRPCARAPGLARRPVSTGRWPTSRCWRTARSGPGCRSTTTFRCSATCGNAGPGRALRRRVRARAAPPGRPRDGGQGMAAKRDAVAEALAAAARRAGALVRAARRITISMPHTRAEVGRVAAGPGGMSGPGCSRSWARARPRRRWRRCTARSSSAVGGPAVLLDTPYGFQENADDISEKAQAYFRAERRSHHRRGELPLRRCRRASSSTPPSRRLRGRDYVFAGPGSPTYALRAVGGHAPCPASWPTKLRDGGAVTFAQRGRRSRSGCGPAGLRDLQGRRGPALAPRARPARGGDRPGGRGDPALRQRRGRPSRHPVLLPRRAPAQPARARAARRSLRPRCRRAHGASRSTSTGMRSRSVGSVA